MSPRPALVSKLSDGRLLLMAKSGPYVLEDGKWVVAPPDVKMADGRDSKPLADEEIRSLMEPVTFPQ